jgi:multidrug efflux pump subunit AcrA (membrane-fusion protein)
MTFGRSQIVAGSVGLFVILLLLGGLGFAARGGGWLPFATVDEKMSPTVPALLGNLQSVVRARGELEAINAYPVAVPKVPTGALSVAWLVEEGSRVETGDKILEFEATQLEIELDNNVASFRSTNRRIDRNRIQSSIEAGSIDVMKSVAELELDVAESVKIDDESIFSRQEILDATLDRDYAAKKIVFADMSLLLRGKYYDIDEGILQVERQQVADRIERVKTSLGKLILRSPGSGMVMYKKNWRGGTVTVGASVWPGNVLMLLVDPTETALKVYVPEKHAVGLEKGQKAEVRVDAFAERIYPAEVSAVSKLSRPISRRSPVKYFETTLSLDAPDPERLKPGMQGEARILIGPEQKDALIIPRSAVHGEGEETWVLVAGAAGEPERRSVTLGAGDLVRVCVESGLSEGERVVIGDPGGAETSPAGEANGTSQGRS